MGILSSELLAIAPIFSISVLILLVLGVEAFVRQSARISFWISAIGLSICGIISIFTVDLSGSVFNHMVNVGGTGNLFASVFVVSALLTIMLSREYIGKEHVDFGEFYLLILFATLGMMLMAAAADLIVLFLGLELMSISLYVLAGFMRKRMTSNESSLKYFLLGAFATGFLLYGIALIYGAAGTTTIIAIANNFPNLVFSKMFLAGLGLLLVGFAFKVGAVPFHMWIPDVYQGAPTTVSGFMSTGAKAAAFSALMVVVAHPQIGDSGTIKTVLAVLSAASIIVGNIVAISQSSIKRMLAYSSIAHAGYMLAGLAAGNQLGRTGVLFYLSTYTFMNIGAFGVLSLLEREEEKNLNFDDYAGLGTRRPFLAALMAVFMISLAGIPPFAGFFGKYYVFAAAINANLTWLAIIGVLMSVVSVYYYLRLVVVMYFSDAASPAGEGEKHLLLSKLGIAALAIAAFAVIELGIFPSSLLTIINTLY
jgi:NADH-quinone oxidoreductase subunit N